MEIEILMQKKKAIVRAKSNMKNVRVWRTVGVHLQTAITVDILILVVVVVVVLAVVAAVAAEIVVVVVAVVAAVAVVATVKSVLEARNTKL